MSASGPVPSDASTTSDWYDSAVHPELRLGPPWVMDDMMAAQPAAVAQTITAVDAQAQEVACWVREAVEAGEPVVTTAVGTAGHAARGVAVAVNSALGDATGARVEHRESADQARAPRRGGVCIAVSHGGASTSTLDALTAARAAGARTALITAATATPAHPLADVVLKLPLRDRSYCHTIGYTTPIAAGLQIGARLSGDVLPTEAIQTFLTGLLTLREPAAQIGRAMSGIQRFVSAGSLVDEPSARELALDVAEGAWIPATVLGVEDVLHGHLVGHDEDSALAVVLTGGPGADHATSTAESLLRAASRIGLRTAVIATEELAAQIDPATTTGRLVIPRTDLPAVVVTLLGAAIALQNLTMGLVETRGTNPDLLRREDAKYREAVALGGAKRTQPRTHA